MNTPNPPTHFEPIAISSESTVVAEFVPESENSSSYQSEAELERELVRMLVEQAYEPLRVKSEEDLIANVRTQLERLNDVVFSDDEWQRFFTACVASANDSIVDKSARIQEDHVQLLRRDDGTTKNVRLIDKANVHNNRLQVLTQYEAEGARKNRYDVTILVNGLPMVHLELKRRGVDIREAFNQINRYQRDSFWSGSGLYEYVQLFVISNGTLTKYYSNTTRQNHLDEMAGNKRAQRSSNSFEFTSWWADGNNKPIRDLSGFTRTFFAKHTLLNILTRYCVFTADRQLLVMRPYQIAATEQILRRIAITTNHKMLGTITAGGYVWHTTGSGKTLTSFKTAQLASRLDGVDKVLFIVDRKDLDYQTMKEYERFEKGAANSNGSTRVLRSQLEDPNARIIITTIQKLSNFIAAAKKDGNKHPVFNQHVVLIFDECHRSQFGEMHTAITKAFKQYHLFGFTGTPIFTANAGSGGSPALRTTEQAFGEKLHTYTIVDAITDRNVLPFRIDYVNTIKMPDGVADQLVSAIDTERALLAPERVRQVVAYILKHYAQKTKQKTRYTITDRQTRAKRRVSGFNSLFATASIDAARAYYNQFFLQQQELPPDKRLKVGLIYSYAANEAEPDGILGEEEFETDALSADARSFLEDAILDFNEMFGTSWDTTPDKFQSYYKDLSQRMKDREIDLVIVVNMFLTGFDATTLNTLWVDKNLRAHGLIQAFSRTNRILNSVKVFGNVVSFRDLEEETNDAIALFGNKDARGIVLLKPYGHYHELYADKVAELISAYSPDVPIVGEAAQREFVELWGAIMRLRNILQAFDEFEDDTLLTARQFQDYTSIYLNLYQEFRGEREDDRESIDDDLVFEIELIKQVEINVDYILALVKKHRGEHGDGDDLEVREEISRAIDASPSLRNKKDLIEAFVESLSATADVDVAWSEFVAQQRTVELEQIIGDENLDADATRDFIDQALRDGSVPSSGTAVTKLIPPVSRFGANSNHAGKKNSVLQRISAFFERFHGLD